jgi:hypothetical protein
MCYPPHMKKQGSEHDQRRDALLLRLLKTPPQSREELAEAVRRAKGKTKRTKRVISAKSGATNALA